ncbi:MAG: hypothetical protein CVU11_17075 [Bacteroidetes bacterium HGW-Bacteroidetes-6]|jgi:hypothetical protein|nr:MAG: hypothetical protein CVU11_17075 [Bacteroidetes bacterium HGW-Bacteroidetes-6]
MKKYIVMLSAYFVLGMAQGQTNVYHSFPDTATWRVDYSYTSYFHFPCFADYYFQYTTAGDTLINGSVYKKINRSYVYETMHSCVEPYGPPDPPETGYAGALRDDPTANKTYFVFPGATADSLLYDYNLTVGDSFSGFITYKYSIDIHPYVVSSVDSVMVNGQYRKRWNFIPHNVNSTPYIIEGIGTNAGLIDVIYSYPIDFTRRYLVCVMNNSGTIYNSEYTSEMGCNIITEGINQLEIGNGAYWYPNPFSTQTTLQTDRFLKDARLAVYNQLGQQVREANNISGRTVSFHRNNLPAGIYFFSLTENHKILHAGKVLITND